MLKRAPRSEKRSFQADIGPSQVDKEPPGPTQGSLRLTEGQLNRNCALFGSKELLAGRKGHFVGLEGTSHASTGTFQANTWTS